MAEQLGDRTELPTSRRVQQARSRGQVAKSQDLAAAALFAVSLAALIVLGGFMADEMRTLLTRSLDLSDAPGDTHVAPRVTFAASKIATIAGPLTLALAFAGAAAHFVQVGPLLTAEPLQPKIDRLSPLSGVKRMFGRRGLVRSLTGVLKLALLVVVACAVLGRRMGEVAALPALDLLPGLAVCGRLLLEVVLWMLAIMLLIGAADFAFQRWQHREDLRMTRHEVKEERRDTEGDPEVKSRRARIATEIALQRIRSAVPQADVVVTNPTHFAVALKYDRATMRAPRVTAKGADLMALRIRETATTHGVQIVERPPLARALYYRVEVGREIPPEHYEAVAEVLSYVYRLEAEAAKNDAGQPARSDAA